MNIELDNMKSLSDLLKQKSKDSPIWKGVSAALIVEQADKILIDVIGSEVKEYAKASHYKDCTLTFACLSSTIAQEIKLNEKNIIRRINQDFGKNTVKKIRYLA